MNKIRKLRLVRFYVDVDPDFETKEGEEEFITLEDWRDMGRPEFVKVEYSTITEEEYARD